MDVLLHENQNDLTFQTDKVFEVFNEHHVIARIPKIMSITNEDI